MGIWVSGKFPNYPDIWEIPQIPYHLRNFPNIQSFEKIPKFENMPSSKTYYLGIREISQMPWYLGNFPNRYLRV